MEVLTERKKFALKDYKLAGIMYLIDAVALLVLRIVINLLPDTMDELLLDAIFTIAIQVIVMFSLTMLVHMIGGGKSVRMYFSEANVRKPRWWQVVIPFGMGFLVLFCTMGVSMFWQMLMIMAGYHPSQAVGGSPTTTGVFFATLALTAVLPGICEEFMYRGANLTALKNYKGFWFAVVTSALMFGLGHAFILQTYFTFIMGVVCAYMVLKFKNILPAIIVHFMNNGMSVYLDFASEKGYFGYQVFDYMDSMMDEMLAGKPGMFLLALFVWALCVAGIIALIMLMKYFHKKDEAKKAETAVNTDGEVTAVLQEDADEEPLLIEKKTVQSFSGTTYTVYGRKKLRINVFDSVYIIAAVIIGVAATLISLFAGL